MIELYSKTYGEGRPLIIIHGLFGMSDNWNTLGKEFAKYFNVHIIDIRNHGKSPHSKVFNYDSMSSDLGNYINKHNLIKPIILGHSLGGKIAMHFTALNQSNVEKLIVADIAPKKYNTDFHHEILTVLYKLQLDSFKKREEVDHALSFYIKEKGTRLFLLKNLYRDDEKKFQWRLNIDVLLDKIINIQEADFFSNNIEVPTLFIKGENSNYITEEDKVSINNFFTNVKFCEIKNAGHWLHADNPQLFYKQVIKFLKN